MSNSIVVKTFRQIPFLLPAENMVRSFAESTSPFFDQIDNLLIQNQKLKQARDLLLSRLMNGEIAV